MDPVLVITTSFKVASWIKELVTSGLSLRSSIEKVNQSKRRLSDLADDTIQLLTVLQNHVTTCKGVLRGSGQLVHALEKLRTDLWSVFEHCQELLPDKGTGSVASLIAGVEAWSKSESIEAHIDSLQRSLDTCQRQYMVFAIARIECRVEHDIFVESHEHRVHLHQMEEPMIRMLLDTPFGLRVLHRVGRTLANERHQSIGKQFLCVQIPKLVELVANHASSFDVPTFDQPPGPGSSTSHINGLRRIHAYLPDFEPSYSSPSPQENVISHVLAMIIQLRENPRGMSTREVADKLSAVGVELCHLGMTAQAVATQPWVVHLFRTLVVGGSGVFSQHLALALTNLSVAHRSVRNCHSALSASKESVDTFRAIDRNHSTRQSRMALGHALLDYSYSLGDVGDPQGAETLLQEAVIIYDDLVQSIPLRQTTSLPFFNSLRSDTGGLNAFDTSIVEDSVKASIYLSETLIDLGLHSESLNVMNSRLIHLRRFTRVEGQIGAKIVDALNRVFKCLSTTNKTIEAQRVVSAEVPYPIPSNVMLNALQQAFDLLCALGHHGTRLFVSFCWSLLATIRNIEQERKPQLVAISEKLVQYHRASQGDPGSQTVIRQLARTLDFHAWILYDAGRFLDALNAAEDLVKAWESSPGETPELIGHHAQALATHAAFLCHAGQKRKALEIYRQSKELCKSVKDRYPDNTSIISIHVDVLLDASRCLRSLNLFDEALLLSKDAMLLCQSAPPEQKNVALFLGGAIAYVAMNLLSVNQLGKALEMSRDAVEHCRRFYDEAPQVPCFFAYALHTRSTCLFTAGMKEESLAIADESVSVARTFLGRRDILTPDVTYADCLHQLSACQAATGHAEDAFKTARDAVDILRAVVDARPGYLATLANMTHSLSTRLLHTMQREEAVATSLEAIKIWRRLADKDPYFQQHLCDAVEAHARLLEDDPSDALAPMTSTSQEPHDGLSERRLDIWTQEMGSYITALFPQKLSADKPLEPQLNAMIEHARLLALNGIQLDDNVIATAIIHALPESYSDVGALLKSSNGKSRIETVKNAIIANQHARRGRWTWRGMSKGNRDN